MVIEKASPYCEPVNFSLLIVLQKGLLEKLEPLWNVCHHFSWKYLSLPNCGKSRLLYILENIYTLYTFEKRFLLIGLRLFELHEIIHQYNQSNVHKISRKIRTIPCPCKSTAILTNISKYFDYWPIVWR